MVDQSNKIPTAIAAADQARRKVAERPDHHETSRVSLSAPMNGSAIPETTEIAPRTARNVGVREDGPALQSAKPKTTRAAAPIQTPGCPSNLRTNVTSPPGLASP